MAEEQKLNVVLTFTNNASTGIKNTIGSFTELAAKLYLAKAALAVVVGAVKPFIDAAIESEDAINRLNFALQSQGIFSEELSKKFQNMATDLQKSTRYSDEAIMDVQKTLLQVGEVAPHSIGRVTQAAMDLATVMGRDVTSASFLLAKAAQGSTETLRRYGIIIDDSIPKSQRFAAVLEQIERKMGGAAQNDTKNFSGQMIILKNAWDEFSETLGKFITQNPKVVGAITSLIGFVEDLSKALREVEGEESLASLEEKLRHINQSLEETESMRLGGLFFNVGKQEAINKLMNERLELTKQIEQKGIDLGKIDVIAPEGGSDNLGGRDLSLEQQAAEEITKIKTESEQSFYNSVAQYRNADFLESQRYLQEQVNQINFLQQTHNTAFAGMAAFTTMLGQTIQTQVSGALTGIITGTVKAKDAFKALGDAMIKAVVDFMVQKAVAWVLEKAWMAAHLVSSFAAAAAIAKAWAAPAALVSLATGGANAVGAAAGIGAVTALTTGIAMSSAEVSKSVGGGGGGGGGGAFHSGGMIRAHNGLAVDEVPIIAQSGEGVLSRRGMSALGGEGELNRLNKGEGIGGGDVNVNVYYPKMTTREEVAELARLLGFEISRELRYARAI